MTRASILLATALLLLAGCGTSGGEKAATTDKASSEATTTTAADDGGDDGPDGGSGGGSGEVPTAKQLIAILPSAADVGEDYEVTKTEVGSGKTTTTTADPSDAELDAEMKRKCPAFAELDQSLKGDENHDEVTRTYGTEDDREIEIELDPTPNTFTEANVDKLVDAINGCGTIEFSSDGVDISMKLTAERNDSVGDYGVDLSMAATFQMMGMPMQLGFTGRFFAVDGVGVSITASGGFDPTSGAVVEGDVDLIEPLANQLEGAVGDL